MNKFAELVNGMSAEERKQMKSDALKFLTRQGDFETCIFCGKNVTDLVCDAPIGFEMAGYKEPVLKTPFTKAVDGYRYLDSKSQMFTCDLPVCEDCRTQGSAIFFCGSEPPDGHDETDPRGVFVPDLCPMHRDAPSLGTEGRNKVITKEEAQAWRSQTRMMIENGKLQKSCAYPSISESIPCH